MLEGGCDTLRAALGSALPCSLPAQHFRSRHECVTLAFDALAAALTDAESRGSEAGDR